MRTSARPDSDKIRVITGPLPGEPPPIWRKAPRLAPQIQFPEYPHVPGVTPHPVRDEAGHSYGLTVVHAASLAPDNWRKHAAYLHGIDLYHGGYLWEAHEAWEAPWKLCESDSLEANLLQALILNAAAQLKIHMGNAAGARAHSQAARWRLARIRSKGYDTERFLGLDISDLIDQMRQHYGPLWESDANEVIRVRGRAPRLKVEGL